MSITATSKIRQKGISILEVALGLFLLTMIVVSLHLYLNSQSRALNRSQKLSEASLLTSSELESIKSELSDSTAFDALYQLASPDPYSESGTTSVRTTAFAITRIFTRGNLDRPSLRARVEVRWDTTHAVRMGVVVPEP